MNFKDLSKLTPAELHKKVHDLRGQLFVLRFQINAGKSDKFAEVQKLKKQIAQIETIFSSRANNIKKPNLSQKIISKPTSKGLKSSS